jgi:hypothetical protein
MTNPVGRPRIEIDVEELKRLCRLNCTMEEIGAFFGCDKKTIERRYAEEEDFQQAIDQGRGLGKLSVRRKQIQIMDEHNSASMAIWLGKQLLGQRDNQDITTDNKPISINIINPNG